MKAKKTVVFLMAVFLCACALLCGCKKKIDGDEAIAAVQERVDKAFYQITHGSSEGMRTLGFGEDIVQQTAKFVDKQVLTRYVLKRIEGTFVSAEFFDDESVEATLKVRALDIVSVAGQVEKAYKDAKGEVPFNVLIVKLLNDENAPMSETEVTVTFRYVLDEKPEDEKKGKEKEEQTGDWYADYSRDLDRAMFGGMTFSQIVDFAGF